MSLKVYQQIMSLNLKVALAQKIEFDNIFLKNLCINTNDTLFYFLAKSITTILYFTKKKA